MHFGIRVNLKSSTNLRYHSFKETFTLKPISVFQRKLFKDRTSVDIPCKVLSIVFLIPSRPLQLLVEFLLFVY